MIFRAKGGKGGENLTVVGPTRKSTSLINRQGEKCKMNVMSGEN